MKNAKAKAISDLVNGSFSPKEVGVELSTDHRYLQNEFFKCALAFMGCLANNYRKGYYDGRNEFAAKCADVCIKALEAEDLYFSKYENRLYDEILEKMY